MHIQTVWLLAARSWVLVPSGYGGLRCLGTASILSIPIFGTLRIIRERPAQAKARYNPVPRRRPELCEASDVSGRPLFAYRPLFFLRGIVADLLSDHISQLFHRRRVAVAPAPMEVLLLIIME